MGWIDELNVGDKVIVEHRHLISVGTVSKLNKVTVEITSTRCGKTKYRRVNGSEYGGDPWTRIAPYDQARVDAQFAERVRQAAWFQLRTVIGRSVPAHVTLETIETIRAMLAGPEGAE